MAYECPTKGIEAPVEVARNVLDGFEKEFGSLRGLEPRRLMGRSYLVKRIAKERYYKTLFPATSKRVRKLVTNMQAAWNGDPCLPDAALMQEAASCLHRGKKEHGCDGLVIRQPREDAFRTMLEAVLAEQTFSQEALKRWCDCEEIEVHRGIAGEQPEGCTTIPVRPLSSWTTAKSWAETCARRVAHRAGYKAAGYKAAVISKKVPIGRIVAWSPVSEFLSGPEMEVILASEDTHEGVCPEDVRIIANELAREGGVSCDV